KDTAIANAGTSASGSYIFTVTLNGCSVKDTEIVLVKPLPVKPISGNDDTLCSGNNINLTASTSTSGVTWSWSGPGTYNSSQQNPSRTNAQTSYSGSYIVSAILNGCSLKDTTNVLV